MSLQTQVDSDIKDAMRAKDAAKLGVLRMLKAALMNAAIEKAGAGTQLDDAEAGAVIRKEVKKRQDSVESFEKAGRQELADKEKVEIVVLTAYLPLALGADELAVLVRESIAETGATSRKEMGAVMKIASAKAAGRVDGRTLSAAVQQLLP